MPEKLTTLEHTLQYEMIDRLQRIKEARAQSQKEIEELKAAKNAEFAAFEKQIAASAQATNMDADADVKIAEIMELYQKNRALVSDKLLNAVLNVKPEVRGRFNFVVDYEFTHSPIHSHYLLKL